ncbi:DNA adenine methylase [Methanohalobium evestigatum Z-7303]|uniref:site-specific DNA-methyltransferase (adenine-specific) n=1 Tax=Methanohalobium evestigatum (strain ATCC BAA-1072 / DSM 3721 / NBRC 107634 / OCM 161 / Z-7303) TaxID=644295 RepID=D7E6V1_METEZ|nr:DNA adenine methylase [Methanohalobium evestigatum]ADI73575.1 DNA adenine methylase [Methanohalobium evestigatum Z-7303]
MQNEISKLSKNMATAKPFLKWAGGKKQLIEEFEKRFPDDLDTVKLKKYVEPFVGGGAVFFHVIQNYDFKECHIYDLNEELILAYRVVKNDVEYLIKRLKTLQSEYLALDHSNRKEFYYSIRKSFNKNKPDIDFSTYSNKWVERAAQLIFLNKTCYNGLFRVNSKGEFNVPIGSHKNPTILDDENLRSVSRVLQGVYIHLGDFSDCEPVVDSNTFVYIDPPYRPLNQTSSFNSYSKDCFDDNEQYRLCRFYHRLDSMGSKIMLSNSDPKNENPDDDFFDNLYTDYNIERVKATRMINCNGKKRGSINELIITNYDYYV